MTVSRFLLIVCFLISFAAFTFADLELASVFTDHMVLQHGKPVTVWGTADADQSVAVEFSGQKVRTQSNSAGEWRVKLSPLSVSKDSQSMFVRSVGTNSSIVVKDILVGDVWLCSGQSNMKWDLKKCLDSQAIVQSADHPNLRLLQVPKSIQSLPASEFEAGWEVSSPETVGAFSAVGYIFGQRIHKETDIPIGLIMCAEGSTSVECWVSNSTLETDLFRPAVQEWKKVEANWSDPEVRKKHIHKNVQDPEVIQPSDARTYPAGCFNGMLSPLFPHAIKGVIWYQGEANRERGIQYRDLFPAMIDEWRTCFEQDDFKFYVVQLPEIGKPESTVGDSHTAELREAQLIVTQQDPLMELAVIIDSDQAGNVHPKNKQLPGERLARIALAKDYGMDIESSGPVYESMEIKDKEIHVTFSSIEGGLVSAKRKSPTSVEIELLDEPLRNFAIAGSDQVFHPAKAVIRNDKIIVSSSSVRNPVAVRYAWSNSPEGVNFYNADGLPASPFRTDDWPSVSEGELVGQVIVIR